MCNASQEVLDILSDVVNEFIDDEKTFTAYDVTREARNRTSERIYHNDVRREIHNFIDKEMSIGGANYQVTQHPVHPALQYEPIIVSAPTQPTTVMSTPVVTYPVMYSVAFRRDKRNRLCLRKDDVAKIKPSGFVNCWSDGIVTDAGITRGVSLVGTFQVDKYGNVRITENVLTSMGIPSTQNIVSVSVNLDQIKLS